MSSLGSEHHTLSWRLMSPAKYLSTRLTPLIVCNPTPSVQQSPQTIGWFGWDHTPKQQCHTHPMENCKGTGGQGAILRQGPSGAAAPTHPRGDYKGDHKGWLNKHAQHTTAF
mmetsp:Transcript_73009/g.128642  ORF Transcript_73009/g.128642 Transcript_73009/m.128642 type:complete len:112 (-) Transcript_73009:1919-2254(-)